MLISSNFEACCSSDDELKMASRSELSNGRESRLSALIGELVCGASDSSRKSGDKYSSYASQSRFIAFADTDVRLGRLKRGTLLIR